VIISLIGEEEKKYFAHWRLGKLLRIR